MVTVRTPLPYRRQNESVEVGFAGRRITVCMGFDPEGRVREVFAAGEKEGSEMAAILDDACVLISVALQHDVPAAGLLKSLGRVPVHVNGEPAEAPASPIGAILTALSDRPDLRLIGGGRE